MTQANGFEDAFDAGADAFANAFREDVSEILSAAAVRALTVAGQIDLATFGARVEEIVTAVRARDTRTTSKLA